MFQLFPQHRQKAVAAYFERISKDTIDTGIIILTVSAGAGRRSSGIGIIATIMLLSVFQYGCRSRVLKSRASICRRRTLSTISSHPQEMFDKQSIQMKANAYIITKDDTGQINTKKTAEIIRLYGFVIIPNLYEGKDLESLATTFVGKTDQTMDDLSNLLLKNDSKLKVGSKNGYHEICLRSPGRYDVSTQFSEFGKKVLTPIESVVSEVLGKDYATAFCGVVYSEPGSEDQQWHADSLHISNNHEEANLLNGLLALHDIDLSMGPTEFSPMSHLLTNHQTNEKVNGINIVYQHPENLNRPELVGAKKENNVCLPLSAGSVVLFDDRILHRGRGNTSNRPRYVGYFSYRRPWFEASTHFEATRSLYEDDEDLGYLVRSEFPALGDHYPSIFADGAGGSQVHHTVIDAVSNQLRHGSANLGGNYSTSELCLLTTKHARVAMSDFLNCDADEIVFGHNTTTLIYHLAHSIFDQSPTMSSIGDQEESTALPWVTSGTSNIVLSTMEHDANAGPWERLANNIGCEVRWIPFTKEGGLNMSIAKDLIDTNTKLVAVGYASNSLGTIHDVRSICQMAKNVGSLSFIDAVHYAPHDLIDVQKIQCDFLTCSPYKFYGPHSGVLYGKRNVLEGNPSINPYKIRTAQISLAADDSYQMSMWELGTPNFEALAGIEKCVDYIASIGRRYGEGKLKSMSDGSGGGGGSSSRSEGRREDIVNGWSIIRKHENNMKTLFLNETSKMRNLNVYGVTNVQNVSDRTATFGISVDGLHPEDLCTKLTDKGIYCTSGNHYCTFWDTFEEGGGGKNTALNGMDGVTRIGFLHYNTINDVQNVLNVLQDICKDAAK